FRKVVEQRTKRLVSVYAFTFLESLDYLSPRLSGRYVSNHRYAEGSPDTSITDDTGGIEYPSNYMSQPFPTIYISNNLPYAEPLENGTDTMEPQNIYGQAHERVKGIDPSKIR
ncbi:hypothetical protein, partial [Pseudoalteromonas sp. GABNS16H]|uniref:hypothetical protein n=1 Tax=Pseudoalteromonas sp. GABNS16H TaxID=3025325 RepID=UPI00235E0818